MRNRCLPVFPKVDAASPRGLMAPPGLTALGAKGSVRDRLTPPRRVEGFALGEVYSTAALAMWAPLHYRRRPLMKKPLELHLLKRVPPACKGERTMRWRGRPPIGGQDSDRVSHRCSAPYTLLPLRGISPQGETRK